MASILKKERQQNNEDDGESDKPGKKRKKKDKDKRKVRNVIDLNSVCVTFKNIIMTQQISFEKHF